MNTNGPRILLADDDPALLSALALLLETRLNAKVVGEASSMESVLDGLKQYKPDIVILDWELPGAPRKDRIALLHKRYPALKVVLIGTQPGTAGHTGTFEADAYISKSEPPEQMVQLLQAI